MDGVYPRAYLRTSSRITPSLNHPSVHEPHPHLHPLQDMTKVVVRLKRKLEKGAQGSNLYESLKFRDLEARYGKVRQHASQRGR